MPLGGYRGAGAETLNKISGTVKSFANVIRVIVGMSDPSECGSNKNS